MDTNKMREQFEEFMRRKPKRMRGAYLRAFEAGWKSSREAVVVELPSEDTCRTRTSKEEAAQDAYNHALGECRSVIEAKGLKVAP